MSNASKCKQLNSPHPFPPSHTPSRQLFPHLCDAFGIDNICAICNAEAKAPKAGCQLRQLQVLKIVD